MRRSDVPDAYVRRILTNTCLDTKRSQRSRPALLSGGHTPEPRFWPRVAPLLLAAAAIITVVALAVRMAGPNGRDPSPPPAPTG